jgi:uncharacterized protein
MHASVYDLTVGQFSRGLINLKGVLQKGHAFADSKKVDFSVLLQTRLAPDQFPLSRQIQIACDVAKTCCATLAGLPAPAMEDKEQTLEELMERIDRTLAFLQTINAEQFSNFEKRTFTSARRPGLHLEGRDYLHQHAIPNFYFHMTTAYSILRSNGVELGKRDYLGDPSWKKDPISAA